ncbi:MAG: YncE family protein, partial [Flavobacteriaceae bacterium]
VCSLAIMGSSCDKFHGNIKDYLRGAEVVVANRGDASISFIDAATNELIETVDLPDGVEPMYVVYVSSKDKIYVGDRANSQVHIFNPESRKIEGSIDVGDGVFHMWADGRGKRLWVNNDVDNTISVINLASEKVIRTITLDGKPHDVFVTKDGTMAYISILVPEGPDRVYAYNARNMKMVAATEVGEDPHLFHLQHNNRLYVPCQNTNQVLTLDGESLEVLVDTPMDGAHGIFADRKEENLYITGINVSKLYSVDAANSQLNGTPVETSIVIPHNVVLNRSASKLFVTHSGATANKVSIFDVEDGILREEEIITTATNPFGIAYVKR